MASSRDVRNLDSPYSRASARGERGRVAARVREARRSRRIGSAGRCPPASRAVSTRSRPGRSRPTSGMARRSTSGIAGSRSWARPGIRPIRSRLLDRANGLLFTGDTYYSGEIYLWTPETDLSAYTASIDRLAGLEPGLDTLLPAHGPPVAEPRRLLELQTGARWISGAAARTSSRPDEGRRLYRFEHFSILTAGTAGEKPR